MSRISTLIVLLLLLTAVYSQSSAVIDIVMYRCEEQALVSRVEKMSSYVDYFLVVEAEEQSQVGLCFDRLKFLKYNTKVLWFPVRNLPHRFTSFNDQESIKSLNLLIRLFLERLVRQEDIIILSQIYTIVSGNAINNFEKGNQTQLCFDAQDGTLALLKKGRIIIQEMESKSFKIAQREQCRKQKQFTGNLIKPRAIKRKVYIPEGSKMARIVFDCFPYNGQDHILDLRLRITHKFVDFFIISEGEWSDTGLFKILHFNFTSMQQYDKYANMIIYIPLRNMPNMNRDQRPFMRWTNEHLMKDVSKTVLDTMAHDRDVIMCSDLDEMPSREGLLQFQPDFYDWIGIQQRVSQWYFNRVSIFDTEERKKIPNYLIRGTRITTYEALNRVFKGLLMNLRTGQACKQGFSQDYASHVKSYQIMCGDKYISLSGWHFTSVLSDKALAKKWSMSADFTADSRIEDFKTIRNGMIIDSSAKDIDIFDRQFPPELVTDIIKKGKRSIFAPYFVRLDPAYYKMKPGQTKIFINEYLDYDPEAQNQNNNNLQTQQP